VYGTNSNGLEIKTTLFKKSPLTPLCQRGGGYFLLPFDWKRNLVFIPPFGKGLRLVEEDRRDFIMHVVIGIKCTSLTEYHDNQ